MPRLQDWLTKAQQGEQVSDMLILISELFQAQCFRNYVRPTQYHLKVLFVHLKCMFCLQGKAGVNSRSCAEDLGKCLPGPKQTLTQQGPRQVTFLNACIYLGSACNFICNQLQELPG